MSTLTKTFGTRAYEFESHEDLEKARDNGALVVCFVPARVDTNWWHNYAAKATEVRFPKGRVKNPTGIAWPFPLAVVVFRPKL